MSKPIEKVEEFLLYEKISYEKDETVFITQYDIGNNIYEVNKGTVISFQDLGGILVLEGLVNIPGTKQKQKAKYNVNIFQTRVFKDFEKAKHHLTHELSRIAFKISKALKGVEELKDSQND